MQPLLSIQNNVGNTLSILNALGVVATTYLTRDSIDSATLTIENGSDFSINSPVLIGTLGNENAEMQRLTAKSVPSATTPSTFTFASTYTYNHYRGDTVQQLLYDNIVIEKSATLNGAYTVLATIPFQWTQILTTYQDNTGLTSSFYRIKFRNSINSIETVYSTQTSADISNLTGSAIKLIDQVRQQLGVSPNDGKINTTFLLGALNDARTIADIEFGAGKMKEWRAVFEFPIQMRAGTNYITLPLDIDYSETNRALINARYSNNTVGASQPISYIDKKDWNIASYQRRYTTCAALVNIAATTITLRNTGDFPTAGSITFQAASFTTPIMTITYTGNDKNTGVLTGVTGVTRPVQVGDQGWAYQTQAYPVAYTVYDGKLWFDSVIPLQLNGINVYIDYYKKIVEIIDVNAIIPEHYFEIYKNYLRFAIKRRRDDTIGEEDPDYKRFIRALDMVNTTVYTGQQMRIQ